MKKRYLLAVTFLIFLTLTACSGKRAQEKVPEETESTGGTGEVQNPVPENSVPDKALAKEEKSQEVLRVSILGDSISTYTGYIPEDYSKFYPDYGDLTGVEDTWWMQVINNTGMELCANASYSGGTVSGDSKEQTDGRAACSDRRIGDLKGADGSVPDVILVFTGANELLNNIPTGTYDGTQAVEEGVIDNFGQAYGLMLTKLAAAYPEAQIYCLTILEVSRGDDTGKKFPFTNGLGFTASDYNEEIRKIAKARGISLIDAYQCGITWDNADAYTIDGTHPNREGAKLVGEYITEYLLKEGSGS